MKHINYSFLVDCKFSKLKYKQNKFTNIKDFYVKLQPLLSHIKLPFPQGGNRKQQLQNQSPSMHSPQIRLRMIFKFIHHILTSFSQRFNSVFLTWMF